MGSSASTLSENMSHEVRESLLTELLEKCEEILAKNPDNRCCKYVLEYFKNGEGKAMSNKGKEYNHDI